jgi:hypothetical protein
MAARASVSILDEWRQTDIRMWCVYNDMQCPNCGKNLRELHPLANIYPHWTGACKDDVKDKP